MVLALAMMVGALWLRAAAAPAEVTADLGGDGQEETATAQVRGKKVRLQLRDSRGKLLAEGSAPAPDSGASDVALTTGSLGSAGALLEVVSSRGQVECHTLWRYREQRLSRVPIHGSEKPLPDCESGSGWSYRWEKSDQDAPAAYVRERSRQSPDGLYRQIEVFRYTGFRLDLDPGRSTVSIAGVVIPSWYDVVLYPKAALDGLYARFDLSRLKTAPRLRIQTDRSAGAFALQLTDAQGQERFPVGSATPGAEGTDVLLTAGSGSRSACARVTLAAKRTVPVEVLVEGLGEGLDQLYVPVTRLREGALQVFESAEQELAAEALVGTWSTTQGQSVIVTLLSSSPPLLRFGMEEVSVNLERAPAGVDLLLVPSDGSAPRLGVILRGPRAIERVSLQCGGGPGTGPEPCRKTSPGQVLRRVGALLNVP
ncbi:MAG: hypothetical protein ACRD1P_08590 [Thermoanaerobaculia bacterium]